MKLTEKERMLLIVLALVTVWGIGIALFLIPAYNSYLSKQVALSDAQSEEVQANLKLQSADLLDEQISQAYQTATENAAIFYPALLGHQADMLLSALFGYRNVDMINLALSPAQPAQLAPYQQPDSSLSYPLRDYSGAPITLPPAEQPEGETVPVITASVSYTGTYANVKNLIDDINGLGKSIMIQSMTIDNVSDLTGSGAQTGGVMNINIYCVQELVDPAP